MKNYKIYINKFTRKKVYALVLFSKNNKPFLIEKIEKDCIFTGYSNQAENFLKEHDLIT
jgi:hypothetical protein